MLERLRAEKSDWENKLQEAAQSSTALAELQVIQHYVEHLESCIASKVSDVRQAQKVVDQSRLMLSDKMKDEKVWLKAKDHARERFQHAVQLKEQNELDELASVRFMLSTP
ncbi:flagellar biosynthesis chaperone [compost metagenome]